jgi:radical SAM protein with 4Fe4S-binding SPASM domain
MRYYLSRDAALKWLETPSAYHVGTDELYELDERSFAFLKNCASDDGCTTKDSAFVEYCADEGLVTTEPAKTTRPPLVQSPQPSLRYLELQITDKCNLRCKHCYIGGDGAHELSPERVRRVLAEFEEMQGLRVMITGGEPLLHSQFGEINEMLPDYAVRAVLFTNGILLTDAVLRRLNCHEIQVSIDGLEQGHNSLRGPGTFSRAVDAVRRGLDAGLAVSVATMAHGRNTGDFDAMESMFKELGIKDWTVDVPCATGWLAENAEFRLSPEQGGKYLGYGYGAGLHGADKGYGCGLHLMAVLADGKAAKCTFYGDRAVGAADEGLRACWQRVRPVKLGALACDCEYLDACRGGCRYRAELLEGTGGKDLYRCSLYGIMG